jgi:lactate permease
MISPQSIAVGTASTGLVGKESELLRFTLKHSLIMLLIICIFTFLQAYVITWIIPEYKKLESLVSSSVPDIAKGWSYIAVLVVVLIAISVSVVILNRKKQYN